MKSIEMGRGTLTYIGKIAIEISGVGRAQRAYRQEKSTGFTSALFYGVTNDLLKVAMPLSVKSMESKKPIGPGFIIDLAFDALAFNFLGEGNIQAAFIAKFGYNLLVQIAPDVARLAKNKVFHKAK